jgi:hypothetical protein
MTICYPATTDWSCYGDDTEISRLDPAIKARSEALAWYTLASLCAWRIGVCPTTIRPCAAGCAAAGSWSQAVVSSAHVSALPLQTIGGIATPYVTNGQWVNGCPCSSPASCSCSQLSEVILPGPVGGIEEVTIDGIVIPPSAYRVDDGNRLVRIDGDTWPVCQDMTGPGFQVTYYRGAMPNELTNYAAGVLAAEFYRACAKGKCRLPRGVTSVVRQGVTVEIRQDMWEGGITTIPEVDAVISIYNPNHLRQAPRVRTPETRRRGGRLTTWGAS